MTILITRHTRCIAYNLEICEEIILVYTSLYIDSWSSMQFHSGFFDSKRTYCYEVLRPIELNYFYIPLIYRYESGKLEKDLAKLFMTEELEEATYGEVINFSVEMNENDYRIAYCQMLRREGDRILTKTVFLILISFLYTKYITIKMQASRLIFVITRTISNQSAIHSNQVLLNEQVKWLFPLKSSSCAKCTPASRPRYQ